MARAAKCQGWEETRRSDSKSSETDKKVIKTGSKISLEGLKRRKESQ